MTNITETREQRRTLERICFKLPSLKGFDPNRYPHLTVAEDNFYNDRIAVMRFDYSTRCLELWLNKVDKTKVEIYLADSKAIKAGIVRTSNGRIHAYEEGKLDNRIYYAMFVKTYGIEDTSLLDAVKEILKDFPKDDKK